MSILLNIGIIVIALVLVIDYTYSMLEKHRQSKFDKMTLTEKCDYLMPHENLNKKIKLTYLQPYEIVDYFDYLKSRKDTLGITSISRHIGEDGFTFIYKTNPFEIYMDASTRQCYLKNNFLSVIDALNDVIKESDDKNNRFAKI